MTCLNCNLKKVTNEATTFQVFLQTRDRGVTPFIASYQMIDSSADVRALQLFDLTSQLTTQEVHHRNTMMKRTIEAQEDERKRISRELHDSVAQELLSSLVDLRVLKYMNVEGEVLTKIQQMEGSLSRLLDNIRNLAVELRPSSLDDLGLEAAFRTHFKWIEKNYGISVRFFSHIQGVRFSSEIETVAYRICQEALLNAIKYADVDEIEVHLKENNRMLDLYVIDRGVGFDVDACESKGTGLGIYGMRERAELAGGKLSISSEAGAGTTVHVQIPIGTRATKKR